MVWFFRIQVTFILRIVQNVYFSPLIFKINLMKMKQLFTGMLLVAAVTFTACKGKPKDMLAQKWKIVDMTTERPISDSAKADMLKNATMEFTKDGAYTMNGGSPITGKYTLSDDGKTLTLSSSAGDKTDVTVQELTKSKFVGSAKNTTITCVPQ
jgi:hypothetical protein